jgi:hypothetical protein
MAAWHACIWPNSSQVHAAHHPDIASKLDLDFLLKQQLSNKILAVITDRPAI